MGDNRKTAQQDTAPLSREDNSSLNGQLIAQNTNPPKQQQPITNAPAPPVKTNVETVDIFPDKEAAIEAFFADPKNTALTAKTKDAAAVREVQQALMDLKQLNPKDVQQLGVYDKATEKAVAAYRKSRAGKSPVVNTSGSFDKSDKTLVEDHFKDREAYTEAATGFDKSKPEEGTRPLDKEDKTAIGEVYQNKKKKKITAATGKLKGQEENIRKIFFLTYRGRIYDAYKLKYQSKLQQRKDGDKAEAADPTKENEFLFTKSSIKDIADQAKKAVDSLYQNMASASPNFKTGDNLLDQWEEQKKKHPTVEDDKGGVKATASKDAAQFFNNALRPQVDKAENIEQQKQDYAQSTGIPIDRIHALHQRAIEDLFKDKQTVDHLIKTEQGISGIAHEGKQYLQRFKSTNTDKTKKLEEDRLKRWKIFYTSIHEYLHLLQHKDYIQWLSTLKNPKRRILAEGICEFFTLNVYAKFPPSALKGAYQEAIEGRKPATDPVPTFEEAGKRIYPEHKKAEELVRQVGIHNVQAAYFQGKTDLLDETK